MPKIDKQSNMPPNSSDNSKNKRKYNKSRVLKKGGKGGKGNNSDDDSLDSKGNIKNLINYDYTSDSSDETYYTSESEESVVKRPAKKQRKSAIVASKKITKIINNEDNSTVSEKCKTPSSYFKPKQSPLKSTNNTKMKSSNNNNKYKNKNKKKPSDSESDSSSDMILEDEDEYTSRSSEVSSNDEDDYDYDEDEEEEEDDDYDEDEDEDEEMEPNKKGAFGGILLSLGGGGDMGGNNMIPKRYNMKKEPEIVKKFVKLLTAPTEDNSIDTQIDQFKALQPDKQAELITALEKRPTATDTGVNLMLRILTMKVAPEIQAMLLSKYNALQSLESSSNEYYKMRNWLDKAVSVPFGIYKDIPVRLEDGASFCAEFMRNAKKCLDEAVYGQDESKLQIMQFISTKIANPNGRGLSLLLIGPPGIGKTSLIKNGIAKALGWPFQFISLGGDSDASTYTGHQLVYESSHCGKILNSIIASKSMSNVMMFDEVDKISQTPKGEEIQNMLIHLTDPVQNGDFEDKYLSGIPIDLSKVMFVFSANDINKIDRVLLDRMMVIDLKGYDLKQKTVIAEQYILPGALKDVNLNEKVAISKDILQHIIEEYSGAEKGVRELKRCIEQVVQKINMLRMYNSPELPFYIKDFSLPFIVKKEHIKLFLKKREDPNAPPPGMYL
jgi:hypothetical protein